MSDGSKRSVLIINLRRYGDIVATLGLLPPKPSNLEITMVIYKEFSGLLEIPALASRVHRWVLLDRKTISLLMSPQVDHPVRALSILEDSINFLVSVEFSSVCNVSHCRASAYLAGYVSAKQRVGSYFHSGRYIRNGLGGVYCNEVMTALQLVPLSLVALNKILLEKAIGIADPGDKLEISSGSLSGFLAKSEIQSTVDLVTIIPYASTAQKSLTANQAQAVIESVKRSGFTPIVPLAPGESPISGAINYPCGILDLAELIKASKLVISVDTMGAYWTGLLRVPMMWIPLGTASAQRQMPRNNASLVMTSSAIASDVVRATEAAIHWVRGGKLSSEAPVNGVTLVGADYRVKLGGAAEQFDSVMCAAIQAMISLDLEEEYPVYDQARIALWKRAYQIDGFKPEVIEICLSLRSRAFRMRSLIMGATNDQAAGYRWEDNFWAEMASWKQEYCDQEHPLAPLGKLVLEACLDCRRSHAGKDFLPRVLRIFSCLLLSTEFLFDNRRGHHADLQSDGRIL